MVENLATWPHEGADAAIYQASFVDLVAVCFLFVQYRSLVG